MYNFAVDQNYTLFFVHVENSGLSIRQDKNSKYTVEIQQHLGDRWSCSSILRDVLLPKGYPHTVSSDYLQYQIWDTIQVLTPHVILKINNMSFSISYLFYTSVPKLRSYTCQSTF